MEKNLSVMPATTSLLAQKVSSAKTILSKAATGTQASSLAKQLVGSFAHLRPDNSDVFLASIAAVLAQYPLGISQEAADPRVGIARKVEFLSVKALVDWLDQRLAYWQALASYVAPPPALPKREFTPAEEERGRAAVRGLAKASREGALDGLTMDRAVELGRGDE